MSNSIHFEQLFERFSRFLDRQFRPTGERRRGEHGCGILFLWFWRVFFLPSYEIFHAHHTYDP